MKNSKSCPFNNILYIVGQSPRAQEAYLYEINKLVNTKYVNIKFVLIWPEIELKIIAIKMKM